MQTFINLVGVADMEGEEPSTLGNKMVGAMIIGSEAHGVGEGLRAISDFAVAIPGSGNAESLNASIAAAILMYAWKT